MRSMILAAAVALLFPAHLTSAQVTRFEGAKIYRDGAFIDAPLLVRRGIIIDQPRDGEPVETISLKGKFILPAFGDAHTHRFTEEDPEAKDLFLSAGFVYLHNLNGNALSRARTFKDCNTKTSPDVRFANAGFTCTGGHPVGLYTFLANRDGSADKAATFERVSNYNFYITDSVDEVAEKWPKFARSGADILKLFLLHSERWQPNSTEPSQGLKPEVARAIANRAAADGIRIAAHVESAADAALALDCRVSLLAHMPGYGMRPDQDPAQFLVPDALLQKLAENKTAVTPTLGLIYADAKDQDGTNKVRAWKNAQAQRWKNAGILLLYGSDNYFDPKSELTALIDSKIWTPAELIDMLASHTPRWIFPSRSVGSLAPGHEATFITLSSNPLEDPTALLNIDSTYKEAQKLWPKPTP
jgi:imidazolonepropionase-like amidohydrolase